MKKSGQGEPVEVPAASLDTLERKLLADHGLLASVEAEEATLVRQPVGGSKGRGGRGRGPRQFRGRSLDRLQAVQALFQAEGAHRSVAAVLAGDYLVIDLDGRENLVTTGPIRPWARQLALGADEHRAEIDELLGRTSTGWDVSRMSNMDRNILRVALYELLYVEDASPAVVGNEAVVLAKALGTDDSKVFVNGIIGAVARQRDAGDEADDDEAATADSVADGEEASTADAVADDTPGEGEDR